MAKLGGGGGHPALAAVPYLLSLFTAVLLIIVFIAGASPGVLDSLDLFRVNAANFKIPSKLSSSQFLKDLQKVSGADLTGRGATAKSLGLANEYAVHVYSVCAHFASKTTCTAPRVGWWFNALTALKLDSTSLSGDFSAGFDASLSAYRKTAYFMGIGFVLSFVFVVLAAVLSGLGARFRGLGAWAAALSWIATALLLADAVVTLLVTRRVASSISSELGAVGVGAETGSLPYLPFAAFALSLIASVFYSTRIRRSPGGFQARAVPTPKRALIVGEPVDAQHLGGDGGGLGPASSAKPGLLERVTTWSRHRYVQVGKQPAVGVSSVRGGAGQQAELMDPADELRGQRDSDYRSPGDERDIAMMPIARGPMGSDRAMAYEPYTSQLPPSGSTTPEHDHDAYDSPRPGARVEDVDEPYDPPAPLLMRHSVEAHGGLHGSDHYDTEPYHDAQPAVPHPGV